MDLFDRLDLRNFDLAGFSLGGWLAAEFTIRQPQRVRRLALVAPAGLVVDAALAPGLFDIAPQDLPAYLAHDPLARIALLSESADPSFDAQLGREVTGFAKLIRSEPQGNPKLAHWLHRITIPTLALWGANDRLRPTAQAQAWMRRACPGRPSSSRAGDRTPGCSRKRLDAGRHVIEFRRLGLAGWPFSSRAEDNTDIDMPPGITTAISASTSSGTFWARPTR